MKPFLISYDLDKPGQNYDGLISRLKQYNAKRVLMSQWILGSSASALEILKDLRRFMDSNDRILVVETSGDWAYANIMEAYSFKQIAA